MSIIAAGLMTMDIYLYILYTLCLYTLYTIHYMVYTMYTMVYTIYNIYHIQFVLDQPFDSTRYMWFSFIGAHLGFGDPFIYNLPSHDGSMSCAIWSNNQLPQNCVTYRSCLVGTYRSLPPELMSGSFLVSSSGGSKLFSQLFLFLALKSK